MRTSVAKNLGRFLIVLFSIFSHLVEANSSDSVVDIFKKSLKCKDRIWISNKLALGTRDVFFFDIKKNRICKWQAGVCKSSVIAAKDKSEFNNAISDLTGYATFYRSDQNQEFLILNSSKKSLAEKQIASSAELISTALKTYNRCASLVNESTIPLEPLRTNHSDAHLSGFCMHEDFHLYQRKWKRKLLEGDPKNENKIEVMELLERLSFHLLAHNELSYQGRKSEAQEQLRFSAYYYQKLKNTYPLSLAEFDDKFEGTSTFVEARSIALFENGCEMPDEELNSRVNAYLKSVVAQHFSSGGSPYILSSLASQALTLRTPRQSSWQKAIETSEKTPLELLLEEPGVHPKAPPTDSGEARRRLAACLAQDHTQKDINSPSKSSNGVR